MTNKGIYDFRSSVVSRTLGTVKNVLPLQRDYIIVCTPREQVRLPEDSILSCHHLRLPPSFQLGILVHLLPKRGVSCAPGTLWDHRELLQKDISMTETWQKSFTCVANIFQLLSVYAHGLQFSK